MLAFALLLALFCFWTAVGYPLLWIFWTRRNLLQNLLLAPTVGLSAIVIPTFWLNRAGIPVGHFGPYLAAFLLLSTCLVYWKLRIPVPLRRARPFVFILLAVAIIIGMPMFEFGFNWISVATDDMGNYVLAANRFRDYGYFQQLEPSTLVQNRDYSMYYWSMHVASGQRSGSELLLAWIMSCTGLSGHQAFMAMVIALNLSLLCAAAALVLQTRQMRRAAAMVALLLGFSAMNTLGVVFQFVGQIFGLAMLCSCAALYMRPLPVMSASRRLKLALLLGFQFAASLIIYPELLPFFALSCVSYYALHFIRARRAFLVGLPTFLFSGVVSAFILTAYAKTAYHFLLGQLQVGTGNFSGGGFVLFPYFLIPSGLAQLWGFFPMFELPSEPVLSIGILVGALLLLLSIVAVSIQAWRGQPAAVIAFVMLLVTLTLIRKQADYGLVKMGMFCQPFLLGTIVRIWLRITGDSPIEQLANSNA